MKFFPLFVCALFAILPPAVAQDRAIRVGDEKIMIPAPEGFVEVASENAEFQKIFETFVPPSNKLHAGYITQRDADAMAADAEPLFDSYLMVQSVRSTTDALSIEDFATLRQNAAADFEKVWDEVKGKTETTMRENIKKATGAETDLTVQGMRITDRYADTDTSLCFNILAGYQETVDGAQETMPVVSATCFLLLKNRIVLAYAFRQYTGMGDESWAKSFSESWASSMMAANPSVDVPPGQSSGGVGIIMSAVIGGLMAVVALAFFKRRR